MTQQCTQELPTGPPSCMNALHFVEGSIIAGTKGNAKAFFQTGNGNDDLMRLVERMKGTSCTGKRKTEQLTGSGKPYLGKTVLELHKGNIKSVWYLV